MDVNNPVVKLCMQGTQAEFERRLAEARTLYQQAWDAARDDFEACIAAHYVARFQDDPQECLRWNQAALLHAEKVAGDQARDFFPSLYVNLGHACEQVGMADQARHYYALAADLGLIHQAES